MSGSGRPDFRLLFVERAPLFRGLPPEVHHELLDSARESRVLRKSCFVVEGEPANEVFLLCAGRVKVTRLAANGLQIILRLTGPGEVFGGLGATTGTTYTASAEALEPSHVLAWEVRVIDAMAERHPALLQNTIRILEGLLGAIETRYRELATERVPQRLAHALLRLVGHMGRRTEDGVLVSISREELARMTGTTLFTVSRVLGEWEVLGLVRPRREGVVVMNDTSGLVAVANGIDPLGGRGQSGAGSS